MRKIKIKLEDFEIKPLTKRELRKVLAGDGVPTTTDPSDSSFPKYTVSIISSREVEASKEL